MNRKSSMLQNTFDSPGQYYTLYYDESNNHRKFYINAESSSYNVDNDASRKHAVGTSFMLAGVAHKSSTLSANIPELFDILRLQKSAKELKFGQIASGVFDISLKSARLRAFLKWLLASDLYVHYFVLNMEYWAFIDIIEDCVLHCLEKRKLVFANQSHFREYLDFHKDALYRLLKLEKQKFLDLARSYAYPRITGHEKAFVGALHSLVADHVSWLLDNPSSETLDIAQFASLAELLSLCDDIEEMTLTRNLEEGALIDGFSIFYRYRSAMLAHSEHVFDEEFEVQDELLALNEANTQPVLKYRFVKSIESPLTQVSDVVAGLFAKYFDFLDQHTLDELIATKATLAPQQLETLHLMKALVEKSDDECMHLLHYVTATSVHKKHYEFMFPGE